METPSVAMSGISATGVPHTTGPTGGNFDGPEVDITGFDDCIIESVRVEFFATAPDLAVSTANAEMVIRLDRPGAGPIGFNLIDLEATTGAPLTGTNIGSSCGTLVFEDGSPPFSSAGPPYDGAFAPFGDEFSPDGSFSDYIGKPANGNYGLYAAFIDDPITFGCFRLTLETVESTP